MCLHISLLALLCGPAAEAEPLPGLFSSGLALLFRPFPVRPCAAVSAPLLLPRCPLINEHCALKESKKWLCFGFLPIAECSLNSLKPFKCDCLCRENFLFRNIWTEGGEKGTLCEVGVYITQSSGYSHLWAGLRLHTW